MNTTIELIEDIRAGKMVILMDDEHRENEGDLVMAASLTRAEDINFMASYGRGLICLTLTHERCQQLRLPLMVDSSLCAHGTNFTLSIEAASGVSTGISAADRARTIQAAVNAQAKPDDIVQPGHIFPVMAASGGVLNRAGHTEAGCDLARLAGLEPAATIVEILNPDGTMARRTDLEEFAAQHDLKIGTIEDLIRYRTQNEKSVQCVVSSVLSTVLGDFRLYAYQDTINNALHLVLVKGEIDVNRPIPVRVHVENILVDALGADFGGGWPIHSAMSKIAELGQGVLVLLRDSESTQTLIRDIKYHREHTHHTYASRSNDTQSDAPEDWRTYGVGAQILADLGVGKMQLLSAPKVFHGLAAFGLEVTGYIAH